jgi:hypothetical protein
MAVIWRKGCRRRQFWAGWPVLRQVAQRADDHGLLRRARTPGEYVLPVRIVPFPRGFAFGHDSQLFLASGIGPNGEGDDTIVVFAANRAIQPFRLIERAGARLFFPDRLSRRLVIFDCGVAICLLQVRFLNYKCVQQFSLDYFVVTQMCNKCFQGQPHLHQRKLN